MLNNLRRGANCFWRADYFVGSVSYEPARFDASPASFNPTHYRLIVKLFGFMLRRRLVVANWWVR